jgi:hypothetical protein
MSDFIYTPKSLFTTNSDKNETVETEFFTSKDSADFIDEQGYPRSKSDSNSVFAKKNIRKNGSHKYSIRMGNNGKFFNPFSIYDKEHDNIFINKICRSSDKFKEVNIKVFGFYMEFLNTKNIAWLNNAERENE